MAASILRKLLLFPIPSIDSPSACITDREGSIFHRTEESGTVAPGTLIRGLQYRLRRSLQSLDTLPRRCYVIIRTYLFTLGPHVQCGKESGRVKNRKGVCGSLDEPQPAKHGGIFRWLRSKIGREPSSKTDIQQVIDQSEERGLIDQEEGDMIDGIFDLRETVAREIMIPRTHIVSATVDCDLESLLKSIIESGHSRIPVCQEDLDHIVGILNAKDLLPLWLDGCETLEVRKISRPPYFVPETKPIKDLLNELRSKKSHLAVIVDEYGGTSGIVTIEDIIEEIIGEIRDEHDMEEDIFVRREDGSVVVNARANLDDFEEIFGIALPRGGYDSLGGFIIHLLGKVPLKGEELSYEGFRIQIKGGDQKCITSVLVTPPAEQENGSCPCLSDSIP